jgi:DNA-binding beta-propeller fold protein YncE
LLKTGTILSIAILLLISLTAISQENDIPEGILYKEKGYTFPYNLISPDKKTKLPSELREISGIQSMGDGIIAGVEDEHGIIYLIDFHKGEIKKEIDFGEKGDYEGLAIQGSTAWVLKSNGNLYRVKDFKKGKDDLETKKYDTPLGKGNDVEGLAYDKANKRLLLACKGHPFIDDRDGKHTKAVYAFDLESKKLLQEPVLIIDLKLIQDIKDYNWFSSIGISIMSRLDENKGDVSFQPSDIAIHPVTGNYYIIGAVGDLLLVYSPEGILLAAVELADIVFKQAEGISFSAKANMYICNEGGDGKGNILKFTPKF